MAKTILFGRRERLISKLSRLCLERIDARREWGARVPKVMAWIIFMSKDPRSKLRGSLLNPLWCHSDDYVSLFVTLFDIPVRLNDLFQGIASINDRFQLSSLGQLCQEAQIFDLLTG
jgi:hypothetical protein